MRQTPIRFTAAAESSDGLGQGVTAAVVLTVLVFVLAMFMGDGEFIGVSLLVAFGIALVFALSMFLSWRWVADYPLMYRDGDRPEATVSSASPYETWTLGAGARVSTTFDVERASDADSLSGELGVQYGCPDTRVDWRIYVDGVRITSGSLGEGDKRELGDVKVKLEASSAVVQVTAVRMDKAECETTFQWESSGLEGPGHGPFRFVIPPVNVE